jgi:hypothetical protein
VGFSVELSEAFRSQVPETVGAVRLGRFLIGESPSLALAIAESFAQRNGLPGFAGFLVIHENEIAKPVKPTKELIDYIISQNPPPAKTEVERRFFQRALERRTLDDYFDKLRDYEKKTNDKEIFSKSFPPNVEGYIQFICSQSEDVRSFFFDKYKVLPVSEENRKRHSYIVGASGSGKSEVIKWLCYHYLKRNTSTAVVLIEPHGKLSREVARWPELQGDRLVYIRPGMEGDKTPIFNPFDIDDEQRKDPRVVSVLVDDTIDVIAEIMERDWTPNMDTLLRACLYILYSRKDSTFLDVLRFVDTEKNTDLIEVGRRIFPPSSPLLSFILHDLPSQGLGPTRQSIKMRFTSLLSRHFISSFLIGKSTFNIEKALQARRFIIFNLSSSDIGRTESRIFGKLILAHIKAFGFRQGREEHPKSLFVPIHLIVDECQEFITLTMKIILQEARKFGLHLTLSQQTIGQGMSKELAGAVLANTAIKITGKNAEAEIKRFCAETGADPADLAKLDKGQGRFCVHSAGQRPTIVKTPGHRLDSKGAVADEVWQATLAAQVATYYGDRRVTVNLEAQETEGEAGASQPKAGFAVASGPTNLKIDY